jgi:hypothetical protein
MMEADIKKVVETIKKLVEPNGWLTITDKRKNGKTEEIFIQISFKIQPDRGNED